MLKHAFLVLSAILFLSRQSSFAQSDSTAGRVIHSVLIKGNNTTQAPVILREMSLHAGDSISQKAMDLDRDRIYNLGLFNKVTVTPTDSAGVTDLVVTVVERWYIWPIPILSLRSRSVNSISYGLQVTHQNFLGRDERVSAGYSTGYDRNIGFTYQTPRVRSNDDVYIRAMFEYRDVHSLDYNSDILFEQINRTASFSLGKRIGYYQTLIGTVGYQLWQLPDTSLGRTVSPDGTDKFLELGAEYTLDSRNVREYPTDGTYLDVNLVNDGIGAESTVKNTRLTTDVRTYWALTADLSLGVRMYGSFVTGGAVPMYHRIFLSNRMGVRGYNQRNYAGEDLTGVSAEVRLPLITPRFVTLNFFDIHQFNTMRFGVYAAAFIDAGKIWFRSDNFGEVPWLASIGGGLHFLLPYGIILRTELSVNALAQVRGAIAAGLPF